MSLNHELYAANLRDNGVEFAGLEGPAQFPGVVELKNAIDRCGGAIFCLYVVPDGDDLALVGHIIGMGPNLEQRLVLAKAISAAISALGVEG